MKNLVRPRLFGALAVSVFMGLMAHPAAAAFDITQARYITSSQFWGSLNQVSLTVMTARGSAELSRYLPQARAREIVQDILARTNTTVRTNSPVALEVRIAHESQPWKNTTTTFLDGIAINQSVENYTVHLLLVSLHFYVRGAVLRNDRFHVLPIAVTSGWSFNHVVAHDEAGARTAIADQFLAGVSRALESINSNKTVDNTPWPPATWTETQKVQKNAEFERAMRPGAPMDQSLIADLDGLPRLDLNPTFMDSGCVTGAAWQKLWDTTFQRLKWTKPQARPTVSIEHRVDCQLEAIPGGDFFRSISAISLREANVLFELNGELFRKQATLLFSEGIGSFDPKDRNTVKIDLSGEVFLRFGNALDRGTRDSPALPGTQLAAIAASAKGTPIGRLILGGDVRFEQGEWRYATGGEVPDTLLDKATAGPPLRPRSQHPVTQAPVSTHVTDMKSAFGAIKSCQLYASATRENLLWSVISPALELDDAGVIVSRYVLSTRPGQGYAQGAAIANLSLASAQIQDRGGCKVVLIPCKTGQCVRFEENASPSLTFFVETTEQANRVLGTLRAIAPFYPSGAGELRTP